MDRDTVIALARQADLWLNEAALDAAVRFAALVAEREREECAKVCDPEPSLPNEAYTVLNIKAAMRRLAAAIRSRT